MQQGLVSVLVCTRDRPHDLLRLLRSLLAGPPEPGLQVIVVDQSAGDETRRVVSGVGDARVELVRSEVPGKGRALNRGLSRARAEIVVLTDDDCEAPAGWAAQMSALLHSQPAAAVLFCQVLAAHVADPEAGYIPTCLLERSRLVRRLSELRQFGLGAGMAVRAAAIRELGGFDEAFGPGASFPSCDDWDIAQRALLRGWALYEARELAVVHHGFRSYSSGREHTTRDWLAIGGLCAKAHRSLSLRPFPLWFRFVTMRALLPVPANILLLRRRLGLARVTSFARGFSRGLRLPLDRQTLCFIPPSAD